MDTRTPEQRRRIMQAVKQKDTAPELLVRSALYRDGYRYRLHAKDLPGRPDIVFPGRKKVLFIHGCFWHSHGCSKGKAPKSHLDYWAPKLRQNVERDAKVMRELQDRGWKVLIVWQCETSDMAELLPRIEDFLNS